MSSRVSSTLAGSRGAIEKRGRGAVTLKACLMRVPSSPVDTRQTTGLMIGGRLLVKVWWAK
jgi:hypothetical protein